MFDYDNPIRDYGIAAVAILLVFCLAFIVKHHNKPHQIKHSKCYIESTCGETNDGKPVTYR